ncbi:MAG: hypothetical protein HY811_04870 [Planctomycetes bacterium]|nr:hypothetical protein [Planctomycetota bacterium]
MKKRLSLIISAIATLLLSISIYNIYLIGEGDDKGYELKGTIAKGQTQTVMYKRQLKLSEKIPNMPRHPPVEVYEEVEQTISQKIIEVKETNIIKAERKYLKSTVNVLEKKPNSKPDELNGKTIAIEIKDGMVKRETKDKISDEIKNNALPDDNNFLLFLPANKVKRGDKWDVVSSTALSVFNFTSTRARGIHHGALDPGIKPRFDDAVVICTLKEVKKIKGDETAIIEITGVLKAEEEGLKETIALSGTAHFLVSKGKFIKLDFYSDISIGGVQPCSMGRPSAVEGSGSLKLAVEFKQ